MSEKWLRNRDIEEAENNFLGLGSRLPSPQRVFPSSRVFRRSSSQPSETTSRSSRSPSPSRFERSFRSPSIQRSESPFRSFRSRSPSPLIFSPVTKTFVRSNSYDTDSNLSYPTGSSSSRESSLPRSSYRRSSSYEGERRFFTLPSRSPSPQRHAPFPSFDRRSNHCENDDRIRSNFRARSSSPQRLTPASSYHRKQGSNDNGVYYTPSSVTRSPSIQSSPYLPIYFNRYNPDSSNFSSHSNRNYDNLKNYYARTNEYKFNSLPRNLFSNKANSPKRANLVNLFSPNSLTNSHSNDHPKKSEFCPIHNSGGRFSNSPSPSNSKPPPVSLKKSSDKQFHPHIIPDLPNHKMTSHRRFSEEPSPFRRPLATLHEDEVVARRRFSDDLRKKSLDTSGVMSDYNDHQRRLSEAGIRKLSDASLVLTEDTDSFIIGDRVWVGGTKKGSISYIGETQFAPGEWAGVTLDEPVGKNNGSVGGVRYFQCEPKKGVFSRLTRLSRIPLSDRDLEILAASQSDSPRGTPLPQSSSTPAGRKLTPAYQASDSFRKPSQPAEPVRKVTPSSPGTKSPLHGKSVSLSPASSVKKGPAPTLTSHSELKVGERVIIDSTTGTKYGVLRYLGRTEFSEGVWAGVELDEPTGKNDGSVAGKKYFVCRSKYGLFAPVNRVRSFAHRSSISRSALPTLRRSGSRESLGASSAASSNVSSLRGTRRPSRTSTSGTSPSTKALQETLDEKIQHIDQLMRERDVERGEMARMAAQLDEATRIAQDFKMQLDQLQIESEERLHDFGQKVEQMEKEKESFLVKLEDKQKEIDDLSFRIEEESLAKADFESQSIASEQRVKDMEKSLCEEKKKKGERDAQVEDEREELEVNLRSSVEELQERGMELEQEKENLQEELEKMAEKLKHLEALNSSLVNSVNEKEQKISLLEVTQASEEAKENEMKQKLTFLEEELEKKSKDCEDVSQQAEEFLTDLENSRKKVSLKEKENNELRDKMKIMSDSEADLKTQLDKLKEVVDKMEAAKKDYVDKISRLEEEKSKLGHDLSETSEALKKALSSSKTQQENLDGNEKERKQYLTEVQQLKEKLLRLGESVEEEKAAREKKEKEIEALCLQLKEIKEKLKDSESSARVSASELGETKRQVAESGIQIQGLEETRKKLEEQLAASMSSSTSSSDQLCNLNQQLREAESKAEAAAKAEREVSAKLEREVESHSEMVRSWEVEKAELEVGFKKKIESLIEDKKESEERRRKEVEVKEKALREVLKERDDILQKADEDCEILKKKLEAKAEQMEKVQEQMKTQLEEQILTYKNLMEQLDNSVHTHKKEKEILDKEVAEVRAKNSSLEDDVATLKEEKQQLLNQHVSHQSSQESNEQKVKSLSSEVESLKAQLEANRENLQKQVTIAKEDEKNVQMLRNALHEGQTQLNSLEENFTAAMNEKDKIVEEKSQLLKEISQLKVIEEENFSLVKKQEVLEKELSSLKENHLSVLEDKSRLEEDLKRITDLEHERNEIREQNRRMTEELEALKSLSVEFQSLKDDSRVIEEKLGKLSTLENEVSRLNAELSSSEKQKKDLTSRCRDLEEAMKTSAGLESSNSLQASRIKCLEEEKGKVTQDVLRLDEQLKVMEESQKQAEDKMNLSYETEKRLEQEKLRLEGENEELSSLLEKLKKSFNEKICELETEKGYLVEEVVVLQDSVSEIRVQKETEVRELQEKERAKGSEERETAVLRLKILELESDKRKLDKEVKELKEAVALSSAGKTNEFAVQLKQERDQFEGQVDFLNSVIVDMQRKKDELESRIEVLQSGNIPDDQKASMNGLVERRVIAPRSFCDICDQFDLHETEDCPTQASSDSPPSSRHSAPRHTLRPYCDSCEAFGHEDGDCPDETF